MEDTAPALGIWWSYAEANATVLGVVVALIAAAALLFVGRRAIGQRRSRRRN